MKIRAIAVPLSSSPIFPLVMERCQICLDDPGSTAESFHTLLSQSKGTSHETKPHTDVLPAWVRKSLLILGLLPERSVLLNVVATAASYTRVA